MIPATQPYLKLRRYHFPGDAIIIASSSRLPVGRYLLTFLRFIPPTSLLALLIVPIHPSPDRVSPHPPTLTSVFLPVYGHIGHARPILTFIALASCPYLAVNPSG